MKIIYKITYPNRKIYIGQDLTDDVRYFGTPNKKLVNDDFNREQRQCFSVTRQILWESVDATAAQVTAKEKEFILQYASNNPAIGYNLRPKYRTFINKQSIV